MEHENHFEWGDDSVSSYTNWNDGEPNEKYASEDCVAMASNGQWNDEDFNLKKEFICSKA
eukprot:154992-Rhodomonas_salina.3